LCKRLPQLLKTRAQHQLNPQQRLEETQSKPQLEVQELEVLPKEAQLEVQELEALEALPKEVQELEVQVQVQELEALPKEAQLEERVARSRFDKYVEKK